MKNIYKTGWLFGLAAGMLIFVQPVSTGAQTVEYDTIADGVYVGGVSVGGMSESEAAQEIAAYVDNMMDTEFTLSGANGSITASAEDMGITVDTNDCLAEAMGVARTGNLIQRFKEQKALDSGSYTVALPLEVDKQKTAQLIYEHKEELDIPAEDNRVVRENGEFVYVEGQEGLEVDVVASVYAINDFLSRQWNGSDNEIELVNVVLELRGSREELSHIKDVIGSYSTSYSSSSSGRATNVENGCAKIDGTILYPGEEFSVYEAAHPFTQENGYELASAYANGAVVESFGGGVCQVSTTLYNAAIRAELEITKRYNHSMTVSYVDPAEDAAIAGTYKDLRIVNNYDYPVYFEGYCSGGKIYFNIYGEETRPANREVSFESEIVEKVDPDIQIKLDSSVKFGSYHTEQSSHTGYVARLWKIVTVDGVEESREVFNRSTYQASPKIVVVGTKGATEEQIAEMEKAAKAKDEAAVKAIADKANEEPEEPETENEDPEENENSETGDGEDTKTGDTPAEQKPEKTSEPDSEAGSGGTAGEEQSPKKSNEETGQNSEGAESPSEDTAGTQ